MTEDNVNLETPPMLEKLEKAANEIAEQIEGGALTPGTEKLAWFNDSDFARPICAMGFIFDRAGVLDDVCPGEFEAESAPSNWFYRSDLKADVDMIVSKNDLVDQRVENPLRWRRELVWNIREFARTCAKHLEKLR